MNVKHTLFCILSILPICNLIAQPKSNINYDSAKIEYNKIKPDTTHISDGLTIAKMYRRQNFDSAFFYANIALALAKKIEDKRWIALIEKELGKFYFFYKDYKNVLLNVNSAEVYFKSINDTKAVRDLQVSKQQVLIALGNVDSIRINFNTNIKNAQQNKDTTALLEFYLVMGMSYDNKDATKYDTIKALFTNAYALAKAQNNNEKDLYDAIFLICALNYEQKKFTPPTQIISSIDSCMQYFIATDDLWHQRYALSLKGLVCIEANYQMAKIPFILTSIQNINTTLTGLEGENQYWELKYKYDSISGNKEALFKSFYQYHISKEQLNEDTKNAEISQLENGYQLKLKTADNIILQDSVQKKDAQLKKQLYLSISGLLLFAALTIIYLQRRKNKQAKKEAALQQFVTESELKALRSQLNLHFIQNTFDFIATGIRKNDIETNVKNIKSLSNYMRQVLYKTDKSVHSLEDEIVFIEEYLKTQQMLLPNVFRYTIDIDDAVDTIGIQVPSMLLQPIVENSIKHGFKGLDNGGLVTIKITMQQNCLNIVIGDNGKGSIDIKKEIDYESTGIANTLKKLELLYSNATITPTINSYNTNNDFKYCTNIKIYL